MSCKFNNDDMSEADLQSQLVGSISKLNEWRTNLKKAVQEEQSNAQIVECAKVMVIWEETLDYWIEEINDREARKRQTQAQALAEAGGYTLAEATAILEDMGEDPDEPLKEDQFKIDDADEELVKWLKEHNEH